MLNTAKINWKKQHRAERRAARKIAKIEAWQIWAAGKRMLEAIKQECGLNKSREDEIQRENRAEKNEIEDAAIKAAGII
jgi:hypothetical protein